MNIILRISLLLLLSNSLLAQVGNIFPPFKPDQALKEISSFQFYDQDTTWHKVEFYSEGLLRSQNEYYKYGPILESKYYFDERKRLEVEIHTHKGVNGQDSSKKSVWMLYDQYNNVYLRRYTDSISHENPNQMIQTEFINYVYQDGLIVSSNLISESGWMLQTSPNKYEYDKKRRIKKVFDRDVETGQYNLAREFYYDKKGNHVKTIIPHYSYKMELGIRVDMPADSDSLFFIYNSKQQLIEAKESFTSFEKQEIVVKYNYDLEGRLITIFKTIREGDRVFYENQYLKY
ncbi:MAG: hypothetical protein NT150_15815 [Bacteroidetes bacterium]|nr:hypothetical protein [Bacteroidota bacterium]